MILFFEKLKKELKKFHNILRKFTIWGYILKPPRQYVAWRAWDSTTTWAKKKKKKSIRRAERWLQSYIIISLPYQVMIFLLIVHLLFTYSSFSYHKDTIMSSIKFGNKI